ncbi:hypothetical protein RvY_15200 [Ramazzottius varieornatus]|uniref:Protein kinase domain-containing protein n=1 Tax=Ramazzottius varieornatus TaxID=947166 RepID=A0A1D1W272_RAMVA|nr:hypothetical protein RvY_15200 [Ramazzottius varieornatus]
MHNENASQDPQKPDKLILKIADFGLAKIINKDLATNSNQVGTDRYMAPEVATAHRARYNGKADLWSLGVILYESITGKLDYVDTDVPEFPHAAVLALCSKVERSVQHLTMQVSRDLQDLLENLLRVSPLARMDFEGFYDHAFLRFHIVRERETVSSIASQYGMSTEWLCQMNDAIVNCYKPVKGAKICVRRSQSCTATKPGQKNVCGINIGEKHWIVSQFDGAQFTQASQKKAPLVTTVLSSLQNQLAKAGASAAGCAPHVIAYDLARLVGKRFRPHQHGRPTIGKFSKNGEPSFNVTAVVLPSVYSMRQELDKSLQRAIVARY